MKFGTLTAAALALTLSAGMASATTVTIGGTATPPAGNNNFIAELTAAGATSFVTHGSVFLNGPARLTFTAVAAESGFNNSFTDGTNILAECFDFGFGDNFLTSVIGGTFSGIFAGGSLDALLAFSNNQHPNFTANGGLFEFGVFFDNETTDTFFLAFDDGEGRSGDDNHDDYIIRVNVAAVPVPAAGLMLIGALGGLAALRRRRQSV
jgi:hypothetical protein